MFSLDGPPPAFCVAGGVDSEVGALWNVLVEAEASDPLSNVGEGGPVLSPKMSLMIDRMPSSPRSAAIGERRQAFLTERKKP